MKIALEEFIKEKGYTKYSFSKESGVPWSTLCAFLEGKSSVFNISLGNAMKICKTLDITMDQLIELSDKAVDEEHRQNFEIFKSNVCHDVKRQGDLKFVEETIKSDEIRKLYDKKWYPESFYLLAMLDYLSRVNKLETNHAYDDIRQLKLNKPIYPTSSYVSYVFSNDSSLISDSVNNAIPEFLKFNIVEGDIRNVK